MTKEEMRQEEDFFEELGLTVCDGCKKKHSTSCKVCAYNYHALYEPSDVLTKVRGKGHED